MTPYSFIASGKTMLAHNYDVNIEHFCATVVHPAQAKHFKTSKPMNDPILKKICSTALGKEFGNMAQGDKRTGEEGTDSILVMSHNETRSILKDKVVIYASIVIDYHPQKDDPNRVSVF